jgi:diaminopimelate epimerase
MDALVGRPFAKMNGLGNEIVVLDLRGADIAVTPEQARAIHRADRLAYDQLMVIHDPVSAGTLAFVRIFNNDGTESGACGNGTRCVAWIMTRGGAPDRFLVETKAGVLECAREGDWSFTVDMGAPRLGWRDIPLSREEADTTAIHLRREADAAPALEGPAVVNMGNPHAVFFVADIEAYDLGALGPGLETDPVFPQKANISLAQVLAPDHIRLKVWERGVGLTQACGSAACATLVGAARRGLSQRAARITLPGGDLLIDWRQSDGHVMMTGPVELEFEGVFDDAMFAGPSA